MGRLWSFPNLCPTQSTSSTKEEKHSKQSWEDRLVAMLLDRVASKEPCNSAKAKMAGLQVSVLRKWPLWSPSLGIILLG